MLEKIIFFFNSIPPYIGEGIIALVITIFGGLIVGYFTSKYFARASEIIRVEGLLLEKKITIYKAIYSRVEGLNQLISLNYTEIAPILKIIKENGFSISEERNYQLPKIFLNSGKFCRTVLELDEYIAENRLFFDQAVFQQLLIFQNYIIFYNRFHVIYTEGIQLETTEVDNEIVNKVENGMFIALGIILSDDFLKQTTDVLSSLRDSINNISLKRRKVPNYSYEYFNDENSFLMQRLKDTAIIKEREKITMLISDFCALAVIGNM
jgi:hypothetical protein